MGHLHSFELIENYIFSLHDVENDEKIDVWLETTNLEFVLNIQNEKTFRSARWLKDLILLKTLCINAGNVEF